MLFERDDSPGDDAGDRRSLLDLRDRKAEHRQPIRDRFGVGGQCDELPQPAYRYAHALYPSTQLFEKIGIAVDEAADVVDLIARQAEPLYAEAEGPTGIHVGIVTDFAKHIGVHHSGSA